MQVLGPGLSTSFVESLGTRLTISVCAKLSVSKATLMKPFSHAVAHHIMLRSLPGEPATGVRLFERSVY